MKEKKVEQAREEAIKEVTKEMKVEQVREKRLKEIDSVRVNR